MRNHLKHFLLLAVLTICFTATAVAQGTVKGKVVDAENNEPLIGATVSVSGTTLGTVTDIDGNFVFTISRITRIVPMADVSITDMVISTVKR